MAAITSLDQFNEALDQAGVTSLEGRFKAFKALTEGKDVVVTLGGRQGLTKHRYTARQFADDNPFGPRRAL